MQVYPDNKYFFCNEVVTISFFLAGNRKQSKYLIVLLKSFRVVQT